MQYLINCCPSASSQVAQEEAETLQRGKKRQEEEHEALVQVFYQTDKRRFNAVLVSLRTLSQCLTRQNIKCRRKTAVGAAAKQVASFLVLVARLTPAVLLLCLAFHKCTALQHMIGLWLTKLRRG